MDGIPPIKDGQNDRTPKIPKAVPIVPKATSEEVKNTGAGSDASKIVGVKASLEKKEKPKRPYGLEDIKEFQRELIRFKEHRDALQKSLSEFHRREVKPKSFKVDDFYNFLVNEHPENPDQSVQMPVGEFKEMEALFFSLRKQQSLETGSPSLEANTFIEFDLVGNGQIRDNFYIAVRFYLNPKPEFLPQFAKELMTRVKKDNPDNSLLFKIANYVKDFGEYQEQRRASDLTRTDSVVIYTDKDNWKIIKPSLNAIMEEHPEWFEGRSIPSLAQSRKEGKLGFAVEPNREQVKRFSDMGARSFNKIRSFFLADLWKEISQREFPNEAKGDEEAIYEVMLKRMPELPADKLLERHSALIEEKAKKYLINPDCIYLNLAT